MGVKVVISEPGTKKSYQADIDKDKMASLFGKKIGEEMNGELVGLAGYVLQITGGSDRDGFPMNPSVEGIGRKRVLLKGTPGFHPSIVGERKRKAVRGNTLSEDIHQINTKVVKAGQKPLEELMPSKPKEGPKPEQAATEENKPEEKKQ